MSIHYMLLNLHTKTKIWASGVSIQCIQGPFDSKVLEVILGSFGAFLIVGKPVA